MGMFDGIKGAKRGYEKNKLVEGDYIVRIDRCDAFKAEQAGNCYKVTLTILAVNDGRHKEGEVTHVVFSNKGSTDKQWYGNIKSFIGGVLGVSDEQIDESSVGRTVDEKEQVMAGRVCRVAAHIRASKKRDDKGNPFEYSTYSWGAQLPSPEIAKALGEERVKKFFPNGLN